MMTELSDSLKQFKGKLMIKNQRHHLPLRKTEMAEEQHAPDSIGQVELLIPTTFLPVKLLWKRRTDYDTRRLFTAFELKLLHALNEITSACKLSGFSRLRNEDETQYQ